MTFTPEEGAQIFKRDTMGRVRLPRAMLVGLKRLLEAVTLARWLWIPALQEPSGFEQPLGAQR
jgi:hypothetical protein